MQILESSDSSGGTVRRFLSPISSLVLMLFISALIKSNGTAIASLVLFFTVLKSGVFAESFVSFSSMELGIEKLAS